MEQDETAVKGWTIMKIAGKGWNKTKQHGKGKKDGTRPNNWKMMDKYENSLKRMEQI